MPTQVCCPYRFPLRSMDVETMVVIKLEIAKKLFSMSKTGFKMIVMKMTMRMVMVVQMRTDGDEDGDEGADNAGSRRF